MANQRITQQITTGRLFTTLVNINNTEGWKTNSAYITSGKIMNRQEITKGFTILNHFYMDCVSIALHDLPKNCWQIIFYLWKNITGKTNNHNGRPKTYIKYNRKKIMEDMMINSNSGYRTAIERLKGRNIIEIVDDNIALNMFPDTWYIEDEEIKEKIENTVNDIIIYMEEKLQSN